MGLEIGRSGLGADGKGAFDATRLREKLITPNWERIFYVRHAFLSGMTVDEIRALPSMHPGRADVITGGALVATRIAARLQVDDLIVSESDILDGIALQLLDR